MPKCLTQDELREKAEEYTRTLSEAGNKSFPGQVRFFVEKGERTQEQLAVLSPYIKDAFKKVHNLSEDAGKSVDNFDIAQHIRTITEFQKKKDRLAPPPPVSIPISEPTAKWMGETMKNVGVDNLGEGLTSASKVHESGEAWLDWAKKHAPERYQKGLEVARLDDVGIQMAIDKGITGEANILDAVLADYIKTEPQDLFDNIPRDVWTDGLFKNARAYIERATNASLPDAFQYDTMQNLAGRVSAKLSQDGRTAEPTSAKTAEVESDSPLTRFQLNNTVEEKQFDNFVYQTPTKESTRKAVDQSQNEGERFIFGGGKAPIEPIIPPMYNPERGIRQGIKEAAVKAELANNPNITPREAIKSYVSGLLNEVLEQTNKGIAENPLNKSFTLDLKEAKEQLESNKFNDDFAVMADQIRADGKIDMYDPRYTDGFRKMYRDVIKHYQQKAYLDSQRGSVVLSPRTKIDAEYVKNEGGREVETFYGKLKEKLGNSPLLKKSYEYLDKNFFKYTENLDAWAKHVTGVSDGLLNSIVKGMTGANGSTGKQAVYASTFDKAVRPLYEAEWLKKGSHTLNPNAKITELETRPIKGIPTTTEERLSMFLQSQRDAKTIAIWYGGEGNEGHSFALDSIEGRDAKNIVVSMEDYREMEKEFTPHKEEIINTVFKGFNYLLGVVNPIYKLENGIDLAPFNEVDAKSEGWGIYYPHTRAGEENIVYDKLNRNIWINDIASHKTYSPSNDMVSSAKSVFKTLQNYRDGNAKYAAWTIPVRNVDNYLKAIEPKLKELGLEHKAEWWVDYKKNVFNPPSESVIGKTGQGLMANYILSRLGLNPFVSAKQLTAIPLAVNTIPAKYLFRAKNAFFGSLKSDISNYDVFTDWMNKDKKNVELFDEMNQHIPYALYRNTNGSSELQRFMQTNDNASLDLLNKGLSKVFGDKVQINRNDLLKNIQTPDKAIGAMYYTAAKMMAADEGLFASKNPSAYWSRVGDLYTQAITESQHSSDDAHRSMLATKNNFLAKSLSLFGSQQIAAFNGFQSRMIDYISDPSKENLQKMATQGVNVFITNAMMVAAIDTGRFLLLGSAAAALRKKPEDVYMESLTKGMISNIPIASPIFNNIYDKYQNGVYGRDLSYPIFDMVNDGAKTLADGIHAIKDGKKQKQAVSDLIYTTSGLTGIPLSPALFVKKGAEELTK